MTMEKNGGKPCAKKEKKTMAKGGGSRRSQPVDTGWSWVILAAVFGLLTVEAGYFRCMGIFLVEVQQRWGVSASMASVVAGVNSASFSLSAFLVMSFLLHYLEARTCVMIGTAIMCSSLVVCSFWPGYPVFLVTVGIVSGGAGSFFYGPSYILLSRYFRKRLIFAQALASTGSALGGIIFPLFVRAVLDEYSFPSGMLVIAGAMAEMAVCASFLRPVGEPEDSPHGDAQGSDSYSDTGEQGEELYEQQKALIKSHIESGNFVHLSSCADVANRSGVIELLNGERKCVEERKLTDLGPGFELTDNGSNFDMVSIKQTHHELCEKLSTEGTPQVFMERGSSIDVDSIQETRSALSDNPSSLEALSAHPDVEKKAVNPRLELIKSHRRVRSVSESTGESTSPQPSQIILNSLQNINTSRQQSRDDSDNASHHRLPSRRSSKSISSALLFAGFSDSMYGSVPALYCSRENFPVVTGIQLIDDGASTEAGGGSRGDVRGQGSACGRCLSRLDISLCRSVTFWGLLLFMSLGLLPGVMGAIFLPSLSKEKGFSDKQAAHLLTIICAIEVVSRILPGIVAHYNLMTPQTMTAISLYVLGALCQLVPFLNTFGALIGFCVVFGCNSGVYFSMMMANMIHFMGLDRYALAYGFIQLSNSLALAVIFPLLGALKDVTGTYTATYHFLGGTAIFAATLLVSLPYLGRLQKTEKTTTTEISV